MSKQSEEDSLIYRSDDDVQFIHQISTNLLPQIKQNNVIPDKFLKSNYKPNRPWTDQQLKLLRKYYNKFPNQWDLITEKIGTRTKGCVMNKYRLLKQKKQWSRLTNYGQLNPSGRPWSPAQDQQLLKFAKKYNNNWKRVHQELIRSVQSCKTRYRVLKNKQKKQTWKKQEIELLRKIGSNFTSDWKEAQNFFPNRTGADCRQKYERILQLEQAARLRQQQKKEKNQIIEIVDQQEQLLRNKMINAIQTNIQELQQVKSKRKTARKWIQQEDNLLMYLCKKKYNWANISAAMISRTSYQCQRRYYAILQDQPVIATDYNKIQKQIWTKSQQDLLLKLYQQQPNQWKQISRYFPEKTQSQVIKKFNQLSNLMKNRTGLLIWTKQHKEQMENLIQNYPGDMNLVFERFPDHNPQDIRKKYLHLLTKKVRKDRQLQINAQYHQQNNEPIPELYSNTLEKQQQDSSKIDQPHIQISKKKFKQWTKKQDLQLLKSYKLYEKDWNKIALLFPERTLEQCFNHFKMLQYKLDGFKRKWTYQEDQKLKKLYMQYGQQWNIIKQQIPMRTAIQLKKRIRQLQMMNNSEIILSSMEQQENILNKQVNQEPKESQFNEQIQQEESKNNISLACSRKNQRTNQQLNIYENPIRKKVKLQSKVQVKIDPLSLTGQPQQNINIIDTIKDKVDFKKTYNLGSECKQCQQLKLQIQQIKMLLANLVGN